MMGENPSIPIALVRIPLTIFKILIKVHIWSIRVALFSVTRVGLVIITINNIYFT